MRHVALCLFVALAGCAGDGAVIRQSSVADDRLSAARVERRGGGPRHCRWPALDDPRVAARVLDAGFDGGEPRQAVLFRCRGFRGPD
jgi:hypothetical protein